MKKNDKLHVREIVFVSKSALILLLGYVVVRTVLLQGRLVSDLAPASAYGEGEVYVNGTDDSPALSLEDYAEIVKRNMFDTSGRAAGGWSSVRDFANPGYSVSEELGLALLGTISGSPSVARAVIKDLNTGVIDMYEQGRMIGDVRIEEICEDSVIFMRNGERKTLRFNTAGSIGGNDSAVRTNSYRTINRSNREVEAGLRNRGANTGVQTMMGYVRAMLQAATVEPYVVNDRVEGLRVTGLESIEGARNVGLREGDIICAVNGHTLTSKQKAYQVFSKAKSQGEINLELLRGNELKKLSFSLW
jgi:type II secretion system protein C